MNTEYTLRDVPETVDAALRQLAEQEGKSLNTVLLEVLAKGLALTADGPPWRNLDFFIGSWQEDPAFDEAIADCSRVDPSGWEPPVSRDCGWKGLTAGEMRDLAFEDQNRLPF